MRLDFVYQCNVTPLCNRMFVGPTKDASRHGYKNTFRVNKMRINRGVIIVGKRRDYVGYQEGEWVVLIKVDKGTWIYLKYKNNDVHR